MTTLENLQKDKDLLQDVKEPSADIVAALAKIQARIDRQIAYESAVAASKAAAEAAKNTADKKGDELTDTYGREVSDIWNKYMR